MDERLCWINLMFVPIRGSQKSGSGKQTQAHSFSSFRFCVFHRLCRMLWNLLPVLRFPQNQFVHIESSSHIHLFFGIFTIA